jgi:pyridoxamine 5'-phosphate oxidase family protein
MFTPKEIAYIKSQHIVRMATVSKTYQPDVAPLVFQFEGDKFLISGFDIPKTLKYKNIQSGNELVALVLDDLASVNPWKPRGIKIHGKAEIIETGGRKVLIITPLKLWSWGIEEASPAGHFRKATRA